MTLQAWHTCFWGVSPRLGGSFHVSPEMFDWVQVWPLAGPLKDIQRLVQKPLLHCLGCVLNVVVLLKGEPSPQSEVLSALPEVLPSPMGRKELAVLVNKNVFLTDLPS